MEYSVWSIVEYSVWSTVYEVQCMEYSVWSTVYGVSTFMLTASSSQM
jgi:hypothetical protein